MVLLIIMARVISMQNVDIYFAFFISEHDGLLFEC